MARRLECGGGGGGGVGLRACPKEGPPESRGAEGAAPACPGTGTAAGGIDFGPGGGRSPTENAKDACSCPGPRGASRSCSEPHVTRQLCVAPSLWGVSEVTGPQVSPPSDLCRHRQGTKPHTARPSAPPGRSRPPLVLCLWGKVRVTWDRGPHLSLTCHLKILLSACFWPSGGPKPARAPRGDHGPGRYLGRTGSGPRERAQEEKTGRGLDWRGGCHQGGAFLQLHANRPGAQAGIRPGRGHFGGPLPLLSPQPRRQGQQGIAGPAGAGQGGRDRSHSFRKPLLDPLCSSFAGSVQRGCPRAPSWGVQKLLSPDCRAPPFPTPAAN